MITSKRTVTHTVEKTVEEIAVRAPTRQLKQSAPAARSLTRDFLTWIADGTRTYADVLATWPSSCPRLSIWEDALDDGLVAAERIGGPGGSIVVTLTARGRAVLDDAT